MGSKAISVGNRLNTGLLHINDQTVADEPHIPFGGSGASGNFDLNNITPLSLARQFGEVKFYMGFPWSGSFDTTNILVTRKN